MIHENNWNGLGDKGEARPMVERNYAN